MGVEGADDWGAEVVSVSLLCICETVVGVWDEGEGEDEGESKSES